MQSVVRLHKMFAATSFLALALIPIQSGAILDHESTVIPAERVGNYLRVNAVVNGKPLKLIVDTGAGLNVLTWEAAKLVGAEGGQNIQASGAGTKTTPAKMVTLPEFRLGDAVVKNEPAVVLTLPEVLHCDGLVGYSFLRHFATTFDYDTNTLTVRKSGAYKPAASETTGDLKIRSNHPHVKGQIAGESGWLLLDTGNSGTTNILKWLVTKQNLVSKWHTSSERIVGKGVGGDLKGFVAISPGFEVQGMTLPAGQVTLDASGAQAFSDTEVMANVGAEHIRRFRMTLDYPANKAFFAKSRGFESPLRVDRSGLRIEPVNGVETVIEVAKGSPAAKAGIMPGDVVVEIDGRKSSEIEPLLFTEPLRLPSGAMVRVKFERGGKAMEVSLTLEDLVK